MSLSHFCPFQQENKPIDVAPKVELEWKHMKTESFAKRYFYKCAIVMIYLFSKNSNTMDKIMAMTGMEKIKEKFLSLYNTISLDKERGLDYKKKRYSIHVNFFLSTLSHSRTSYSL
jgi:hypothetical protein